MRLPDTWRKARATLAIAALIALAWLIQTIAGLRGWAIVWGGFIPARIAYGGDEALAPFWLTPLTATLIHVGPMHLAAVLAVLLFCGRAVERVLGAIALPILFLLGAYAAAGAAYLASPHYPLPIVGASGALSAWVAAYAMLFGRLKLMLANVRLARLLNALWTMAAWVLLQAALAFILQAPELPPGGIRLVLVAAAAHAAGFLMGMLLTDPLLLLRYRKA